MQAKVITMVEAGKPSEVVALRDMAIPPLDKMEVRVRMLASPIHPADINVLEGRYAENPGPRGVPGNEGTGIVEALGVAVTQLRVGQQVIFPALMGAWCEQRVENARQLVVIPPGLPLEQAAMIAVNPPTAWRLLHDFAKMRQGDWLVQNAANSAVGRLVIQMAKHLGFRTVNIVRRSELVDELKAIGGDVVVVHEDDMVEEIRTQTKGAAIRLGLNATGGDILRDMVKVLANGSTLVTYGAMSKKPFTLSNGALIFRDIHARGFWITGWLRTAPKVELMQMFETLALLIKTNKIRIPVERCYRLDEAEQAVTHAMKPQRGGKILFRISDP